MKAIYINIDPYLAAFAAWLKGVTVDPDTGETDTPPPVFGNAIPLAVTLPLGADCAVLVPYGGTADDPQPNALTIDGATVYVSATLEGTEIATNVTPAFSAVGPATKYAVVAVSGDSTTVRLSIAGADNVGLVEPLVTVLVRRETASGPVDLVDFAPPLTAGAINAVLGGTGAAAGSPLKGVSLASATNAPAPTAVQINTALGGTGAAEGQPLKGVTLAGASIVACDPGIEPPDTPLTKIDIVNGEYAGTWDSVAGELLYQLGPNHGA